MSSEDKPLSDIFRARKSKPHPLKTISVDALEHAIADMLKGVCGGDFAVSLSSVDYNPPDQPRMGNRTKLVINLDRSFLDDFHEDDSGDDQGAEQTS